MKIRIEVTVDIPEKLVPVVEELAASHGHNYDEPNRRELIKRYLVSKVENVVYFEAPDLLRSIQKGEGE